MTVYSGRTCPFIVHFSLFFMPNFKVIRKLGQCKCYWSSKYQFHKLYISSTTTTITDPNDNINKNNYMFIDIHISPRNRWNYINSDNCAQIFNITFSTMTITSTNRTSNLNINSNSKNENSNNDGENIKLYKILDQSFLYLISQSSRSSMGSAYSLSRVRKFRKTKNVGRFIIKYIIWWEISSSKNISLISKTIVTFRRSGVQKVWWWYKKWNFWKHQKKVIQILPKVKAKFPMIKNNFNTV